MRAPSPPNDPGGSCTATLLNIGNPSDPESRKYFFLTAYHCLRELAAHPELTVGTLLNGITLRIGDSDCASGKSATWEGGVRFIAGNIQGDYALLQTSVEPRVIGDIPGFIIFGLDPTRYGNFQAGVLHYGGAQGVMGQDWAEVSITGYSLHDGSNTFTTRCSGGCSHYETHYEEGGLTGGSSGAPLLIRDSNGVDYGAVNAVHTHGSDDICEGSASMFHKINEDGRVACAITLGRNYVDTPSLCDDDSARPNYFSDRPPTNGGGGAIGLLTLFLLAAGLLGSRLYHRKLNKRVSH